MWLRGESKEHLLEHAFGGRSRGKKVRYGVLGGAQHPKRERISKETLERRRGRVCPSLVRLTSKRIKPELGLFFRERAFFVRPRPSRTNLESLRCSLAREDFHEPKRG